MKISAAGKLRQDERSETDDAYKDRAKTYQVCAESRNTGHVEASNDRRAVGKFPPPRFSPRCLRASNPNEGLSMKRSLFVGAPMLALIFAAAACSSDSTSPIQITADDVNQAAVMSASDATAEDVSIFTASDMTMSGGAVQNVVGGGLAMSRIPVGAPSYSWTFGDGCTYSADTGRFSCPPITASGLTLNRDYAFFDANQTAQSAYSASLTASANFHVSVAGIHTVDAGADTVNRDRNLTVSGLAGAETSRTWSGTGTRNDSGERDNADVKRNYHTNDAVTISSVVVNLPRSQYPWPMSGTITRQISGTASVTKTGVSKSFSVSRTATVTFNGTQNATLTVGGNTYTLDLATGVATKN